MTRRLDASTVSLRGTNLIEASAGTGKTYAITSLYLRLLVERELTVDQILVVTYTRAATAELRDRIRGRLRQAVRAFDSGGDKEDEVLDGLVTRARDTESTGQSRQRLMLALRSFDQAAIFTIHGFCQRTLQNSAFESGVAFDTELIANQGALRNEIAQDFWARALYDAPRAFVEFLMRRKGPVTVETFAAIAKRAADDPNVPILHAPPAAHPPDVGEAWVRAHAAAAAIWHGERDSIIELLTTDPGLNRSKYRAATIAGKWVPRIDETMRSGTCIVPRDFADFGKLTASVIAASVKKKHEPLRHPFFEACEALAERDAALVAALEAREVALYLDLVAYTRRELALRKERAAVQSFDDLLHRLAAGLRGPGGPALEEAIRRRYPAALIDEFQDTDPVQYEVFRRVYHEAGDGMALSLFLIGDPKQAIYAFRGADVFAYMRARRDAGAGVLDMGVNWRSDPRMIRGVNALFERAKHAFVFEDIAFHPVEASPRSADRLRGAWGEDGALRFLFVPRDGRGGKGGTITKGWGNDNVPAIVAADVATALSSNVTIDGRPLSPGDVAVLCRANRQVQAMQEALRALGIPSVLEGDASVFDTREAAEVERLLRAVAEPGDARAVRSAIATSLLGGSGDELAALATDEAAWDRWQARFRRWGHAWRDGGFIQAFRRVLDEHAVATRLLTFGDGERRLTNVHHLGELLQTRAVTSGDGPEGMIRWLNLMRMDEAARAADVGDAAQLKLESDADAVRLVTIHKSKGLEYPVVYCPFLWDGRLLHASDGQWVRFHDAADDDRLKLDFGSPDHAAHLAVAEREALAEHLRLLYVAVTRAKHRCSIVWGAFGDSATSALGYLLHQPASFTTDPAGLSAVFEHIAELDDEAMLADLRSLADLAGPGAISVGVTAEMTSATYAPSPATPVALACRVARRTLRGSVRSTSFSALVSGRVHEAGAGEGGAAPAPGEQPVDRDVVGEKAAAAAPSSQRVVLADVPRGARAGQMMHALLETLEFQDADPVTLNADSAACLERFGFDSSWADSLARGIIRALQTPLAPASLCLADVPRAHRLDELEFTFPTSSVAGGLTPVGLAQILATRTEAPWPPSYHERVARLDFAALDGYLHGFADLVFAVDGRFYLVDYKSNHLGDAPGDYEAANLAEVMASHHYVLQYHIYLVALHRYLALRLPDYDYERHFGGVFYLFLRGMDPDHEAGCGVFYDRPPEEAVGALSRAMGGGPGPRPEATP